MKKIAVIVLLYVIAALPAYADDAYMLAEPDANAVLLSADSGLKSGIARLSTFSLLQVSDTFSLHGKLTVPRITAAETGVQRNAVTYGLRGQFDSSPTLGVRFGWDRYVAGRNSGDNLYSLTAIVKF
ncbi:MAG: hypothetical protein A2061_04990 [Gallionellales bacterium GWA2_59_43]|nr:MAG: hypothetical protein A2061_04990 [Gallionellales bacterium GWA2_59_43]